MDRVKIRVLSKPVLENPILICGMPDAGFVGRLGPSHLAKGIGAKPLAELYSYYLPPQLIVNADGTADPFKCDFFFKSGKEDLIIFTGLAQAESPEGQHIIADAVLQFAQGYGCNRTYTLGALLTESISEQTTVYGTATSVQLLDGLKTLGIERMTEGNITGMNGLLFGLSQTLGMDGIGLFSETLGQLPDPRAARILIEILAKILDLNPNLESLDEEVRKMEEASKNVLQLESSEDARKKTSRYIT